ncbi:UNVERIFIED_CONTAM: hypothetical protein K2H54_052498 [Gekko kuhli]
MPLQWGHFNVESMQETYLLTQGPRRESLFDTGTFQGFGYQDFGTSDIGGVTAGPVWIMDRTKEQKDYLLTEDEEEDGEVERRLEVLEKAQDKFHWGLEEVIRVIPDMVKLKLHSCSGLSSASSEQEVLQVNPGGIMFHAFL